MYIDLVICIMCYSRFFKILFLDCSTCVDMTAFVYYHRLSITGKLLRKKQAIQLIVNIEVIFQ
jgi:hypothetical protein